MAYNISTDIDWSQRKLYATVTSDAHEQVTGHYIALSDSRGVWLTTPAETQSGSHSGMGYVEVDFAPFQAYPHAFALSGRTDQFQFGPNYLYTQQADGANGIPANINDPGHEHYLAAQPDAYNGRTILFREGSKCVRYQVMDVTGGQRLIKVGNVSQTDPLPGRRGDYINHSGTMYRIATGTSVGTSGYILDKDTSNISIGDSIIICPTATITGYDPVSGTIEHTTAHFVGSSIASANGYTATANGPAHVDIHLTTAADIPEYSRPEVGDIFLYTPDLGANTYTGYITSLANNTGFTIITGGWGDLDEIVYGISKMDQYAIDLGPQPDTAMMAVLLSSHKAQSGNILASQPVPAEQSKLELNFNEYDSSVASVATKAHFHVGPVVIGGYALTGGVSSMTANLYGGDLVQKEAWSLTTVDDYFSAVANTGQFYDHLYGVFVVNTTESFAQADMLSFRASVVVNGRKVERAVSIASQPVV